MNPHLPSFCITYIFIYLFINLVAGCRLPPDIGCRFPAGSPDAIGCRVPVRWTSGVVAPPSPCRMPPDHRLHHRSGFGWPKPLQVARPPPLLVQVTLNSLCSTHRHKDNNFCSTLYMVRALFVLSMWDISQFSLFLSQLPTHIS